MTLVIFLICAGLLINAAVGGIAYIAVLEARACRAETAAARRAMLQVLHELETERRQRVQPQPEVIDDRRIFSTVVGTAFANYQFDYNQRRAA